MHSFIGRTIVRAGRAIKVNMEWIRSYGFYFLDRINRIDPDEIKAATISSRLNKGNKDLTGQVGQAGYFFQAFRKKV